MHKQFLLGLYAVDQPRRSRIVYAVLKNELTVSAEYWGLRYDLLRYTRLLPALTKKQFELYMHSLVSAGALREVETGMFVRTEVGTDMWQQYQREHYQLRYAEVFGRYNVAHFAQVMLLANQVVSEWSYSNKTYYPMQIDQQQMAFVKRWFQEQEKSVLVPQWTTELHAFLGTLDAAEANQFVATWSGHDVVGLTASQLSLPETWDEWDMTMWQRDIYARWLKYLETEEPNLLHALVQLTARLSGPLAKAQKSLAGLQAGLAEEEIAQQQGLKLGTVREHLLTASIWLPLEAFPYERFLTAPVLTYFEQTLTGDVDQWRFSMVRLSDDPYEFFVFRLYQIWLTKQEAKA